MRVDTRRKFDGHASVYTTGRPSYAKGLIDCLYEVYGLSDSSAIADIGSGTGKFAAHLLERGSEVFCVEPNDDMRKAAEKALAGYRNFHSVRGDAEHTTLEASSVDIISSAQAFHWFDVKAFRKECVRILKEKGRVFLIWNIRDMDAPLNLKLQQLYMHFCPDFKGFNGGIRKDDPRIREFFNEKYDYVSFEHPLSYDKEAFIARSLSASYSLKESDAEYEEYISAIRELFDEYSDQGKVTVANNSVAYTGIVTE